METRKEQQRLVAQLLHKQQYGEPPAEEKNPFSPAPSAKSSKKKKKKNLGKTKKKMRQKLKGYTKMVISQAHEGSRKEREAFEKKGQACRL